MSSGICKNKEDKKEHRKSSSLTFWIYLGIIILGLLLIITIIIIIYSSFSGKKEEVYRPPLTTSSPVVSSFERTFENIPNDIEKKPFLSSLMNTQKATGNAINTLVNPLYDRQIPIKTGGFRCMKINRF